MCLFRKRSRAMNDLGLYILSGGLVIAVLIWVSRNTLVWVKLLRKGVLVEGRIEAHHRTYAPHYRYGADSGWYLSLEYSYDCNETNYVRVEVVDSDTYKELKDGDRVKVRCLPDDPKTAQLETSAFMTLLRRYGGYYKGFPSNG
jgi:hypothetical protein